MSAGFNCPTLSPCRPAYYPVGEDRQAEPVCADTRPGDYSGLVPQIAQLPVTWICTATPSISFVTLPAPE